MTTFALGCQEAFSSGQELLIHQAKAATLIIRRRTDTNSQYPYYYEIQLSTPTYYYVTSDHYKFKNGLDEPPVYTADAYDLYTEDYRLVTTLDFNKVQKAVDLNENSKRIDIVLEYLIEALQRQPNALPPSESQALLLAMTDLFTETNFVFRAKLIHWSKKLSNETDSISGDR